VGSAGSIAGAAQLPVAGAGGQLYPEAFGELIGPAYPDARTLCAIVAGHLREQACPPSSPAPLSSAAPPPVPSPPASWSAVPLLAAEPLYLRRPDAREPGPPKRVTPS
jgi:tRNA threonylcarbamoyladenosine biosynthesis protein TsaB